ncbi:MAG: hypothetical protein LBF50_00265 [Azoarcus sp.]|jgi:hypothetical protein|nr:hypothetical protein [Azoarcus sp.]
MNTNTPEKRPLDTWSDYRDAVAGLLADTQTHFVVFDPDLAETGLESPQCAASLAALVRRASPGDAIRFLLRDPSHLERDCPRLMRILADFSHRFTVRVLRPEQIERVPESAFVIADGDNVVLRFHHAFPRGRVSRGDSPAAAELLALFETFWLEAEQGPTGAKPLGL